MAWKSAFTTTFIPSARLAMRMGRSARNVRSARKALSWSPPLRLMNPMTTIKKSRMFQGLRMYDPLWNAKPRTSTLRTISIAKRTMKIKSRTLITFLRSPSSSREGASMASTREEAQITQITTYSKYLWKITRARKRRSGLLGPSTKRLLLARLDWAMGDMASSTEEDITLEAAREEMPVPLAWRPFFHAGAATGGVVMPVSMDWWRADTGLSASL
mmetsp:Transcript_58364/g.186029  ORF Transcript_58364/g.186029 Transcript_58364/m.186029 type:complete len:216 (-) Transcript_58364:1404-2051(-)